MHGEAELSGGVFKATFRAFSGVLGCVLLLAWFNLGGRSCRVQCLVVFADFDSAFMRMVLGRSHFFFGRKFAVQAH